MVNWISAGAFGETVGKGFKERADQKLAEQDQQLKQQDMVMRQKTMEMAQSKLSMEEKQMFAGQYEDGMKSMLDVINSDKTAKSNALAMIKRMDESGYWNKMDEMALLGGLPANSRMMADAAANAKMTPEEMGAQEGQKKTAEARVTGVPLVAQTDFQIKQQTLERSLGRKMSEGELLSMSGASTKDSLKGVLVNGQPAFMLESEIAGNPNVQPIIQGLSVEAGPDGALKVTQGPQGMGGKLTAGQQQATGVEIAAMDSAITDIDTVLQQPSGSIGIVGTAKKAIREAGRMGKEIGVAGLPEPIANAVTGIVSIADEMLGLEDPAVRRQFDITGMTESAAIEQRLAYAYAKSLQPDGKLLADTIKTAKEQMKIFGWTSETTARERLGVIQQGIKRTRDNLAAASGAEQPAAPARRGIYNPETGEIEWQQ